MSLHIGFEDVEPWPLERHDGNDSRAASAGVEPQPLLKAEPDKGIIRIDSDTYLSGFPAEVWNYRLGGHSALGWILDQAKSKTPRDPTVREKFNNYRFSNHKERVINLIGRVTRVSADTMVIIHEMRKIRGAT